MHIIWRKLCDNIYYAPLDGASQRPTKGQLPKGKGSKQKRIVEWKFDRLDTNKNNKLQKNELRELRQMIKKTMKPKACARAFFRYCDKDSNRQIIKSEWLSCLGVGTRSKLYNGIWRMWYDMWWRNVFILELKHTLAYIDILNS